MAGRGVEVLLKQRDLTEAVEHDANSPLVSQLAGNGQILGKGPGGLDVASPEQVGPAQGTQRDRLAETIAQLALPLQTHPGEGEAAWLLPRFSKRLASESQTSAKPASWWASLYTWWAWNSSRSASFRLPRSASTRPR